MNMLAGSTSDAATWKKKNIVFVRLIISLQQHRTCQINVKDKASVHIQSYTFKTNKISASYTVILHCKQTFVNEKDSYEVVQVRDVL